MSIADKRGEKLNFSLSVFKRRSEAFPNWLVKSELTLDEGTYVLVSEPISMIYDHRNVVALQVVSVLGEFFVLQDEFKLATQKYADTERIEYNQRFVWHDVLRCWFNTPERLVGGRYSNAVLVFPPNDNHPEWWVFSSSTGDFHSFTGEDVEKRAFVVAVGFITQR